VRSFDLAWPGQNSLHISSNFVANKTIGAHTERLSQLNQRISYLAESSNRKRQRRRILALAQSLERREQRYQATLISDDELDDEIIDTSSLLTEEKIILNTYDYTDLCFGVLFGILLSLLFDLTQQIIANGY
jgi:hypothetical protein